MSSLDHYAARKLAQLRSATLYRGLRTTDTGAGHRVRSGGLNFCSNDYLGLATDPRLAAAAQEAAEAYGVGAGASRLVTGNHSLYGML
ncbi:MAG: 8-amino-7-oxononanoate synthase, partial [Alphaproteobacteria bacterium]|nr:8-amino-7-oxononanoate synthase [Alphaproteobacteria bacterium]